MSRMCAAMLAAVLTLSLAGCGEERSGSDAPEELPPNPPSLPSGGPPEAPPTTG